MEIEEFGWNSPGFKESEFSISVAQEFEFFGQKNARKNYALAQIDAVDIKIKQSLFVIFALRF